MDYTSYTIGLLIALAVSYWVLTDARSRGMNATPWAIGVLLVLIVFLPLYFLMRKPKIEA